MRVTVQNVKDSLGVNETYDIVNMIRNSNPNVAQYIPLADSENVAEIGAGLQLNQTTLNEFINSLVDRIGLVVMKQVTLNNPLKKFKKGAMPLGKTIEEIFVDLTSEYRYDPEEAEEKVFGRVIPNVKTMFHQRNRQGYYKQTIQDESLQSAFISWDDFGRFVSQIINAIYNSAELDEYKYMKLIVDNYFAKGQFKVISITDPTSSTTSTKEFVKKLRAVAEKMTLPFGSRDYNALAVHTRSEMNDLHLLISAEIKAEMDIEVLASAFNMSKVEFLGNITVIDDFASQGLEAVLVDKDWYMVYDTLQKMETIRNPQGLYWNYYYHIWQVLSASRFTNAVAFVTGDVAPVTQVIVSPPISAIKQGKTLDLTAYIRQTDNEKHTLSWSVVANESGGTVATGTEVTGEGTKATLTVADGQTDELLIKATTSYETTEPDEAGDPTTVTKEVVGEAIVTIIPTN